MIGICRYCGQAIVLDDNKFPNPESANMYASKVCNCSMAMLAVETADAKNRARQLFGAGCELFGFAPSEDPEVIKLLDSMIDHVAQGRISSVTMRMSECGKASIGITSKGKISIQRSESNTHKLEG